MIAESKVIGDYDDRFAGTNGTITVCLFPESCKIRWSQCSALADFLAAYFDSSFSASAEHNEWRREMIGTIAYIMNELIENAVKFSQYGKIEAGMGFANEEVIFVVRNSIKMSSVATFEAVLDEIMCGNPSSILVRKVEQNASDEKAKGSGLGFLSIMSDYNARLGWKFEPSDNVPDRMTVTTMARLPKTRK
jgi:hypothetical protein